MELDPLFSLNWKRAREKEINAAASSDCAHWTH
jgi:hypothetical protein